MGDMGINHVHFKRKRRGGGINMEKLTKKVLSYMQKRGRIEILTALFEKEDGFVQWKDMNEILPYTDGTCRSAWKELVDLGLASAVPVGPLKNKYRLTDFGCLVASLIHEKICDLNLLVQNREEIMLLTH